MNSYLTPALALAAALVVAGCGSTSDVQAPDRVPVEQRIADPDATYDGWAVRRGWESPLARANVAECHWSPDQVARILESGERLPACLTQRQP